MLAVLFGVFAALCWSLHDLVARSLAVRLGAFRMAALVIASGGVLLTGFVLARGTIWSADWPGIWSGLLLGFAYGFGVGGLFKAFSLGPISLVGPLTAGYPVLTVLWNVFHGLEPSWLQWACVAATLAGALVVARSGTEDGGINAVAPGKMPVLMFFAAVSALGYATSIILSQKAGVAVGEIESTWISRSTAVLTLLPFLLSEAKVAPLAPRHWAGVTVMGALDVLGVVAISASGSLPGREFAGIGVSAYGAISVVLAMMVLKEKVSSGQWAGIGLIVGGVAVLSVV
jgi:drug/metabolite transporter (DMT)-like permease